MEKRGVMATPVSYPSIEKMRQLELDHKAAEGVIAKVVDILTNPAISKFRKVDAMLKCIADTYIEHGTEKEDDPDFPQLELFNDQTHLV